MPIATKKRAQAPRSSRNGRLAAGPIAWPARALSSSGTPQASADQERRAPARVQRLRVQQPEPLLQVVERPAARDQEPVELV